jgi:pimeloyl-ACP methyl ester carboxylesterase
MLETPMTGSTDTIRAPSRMLLLAELRSVWAASATRALWPLLQFAPRGDGHAVLVLPGLAATDRSTRLLRRYLASLGHDVHGWGLGRNLGLRDDTEARLLAALETLQARSGRKVSIVGWSLGGLYARLLASLRPDLVRSVITLGSPFAAGPRATHAWRVYERVSGQSADDPRHGSQVRPTPSMPTTSIFSRSDGVVAWRSSLERPGPQSENIEVIGSHLGLGDQPAVLYVLADRLAQADGEWKPFERGLFGPLVYPNPERRLARRAAPSHPRTPGR